MKPSLLVFSSFTALFHFVISFRPLLISNRNQWFSEQKAQSLWRIEEQIHRRTFVSNRSMLNLLPSEQGVVIRSASPLLTGISSSRTISYMVDADKSDNTESNESKVSATGNLSVFFKVPRRIRRVLFKPIREIRQLVRPSQASLEVAKAFDERVKAKQDSLAASEASVQDPWTNESNAELTAPPTQASHPTPTTSTSASSLPSSKSKTIKSEENFTDTTKSTRKSSSPPSRAKQAEPEERVADNTAVATKKSSSPSSRAKSTKLEESIADTALATKTKKETVAAETRVPGRSATSAPDVDLSGTWDVVVTDEFKKQYDDYLKALDQPFIVRAVALNIVGMTTEETVQSEQGRQLLIRGRNIRGVWERTLTASEGTLDADNTVRHYRTPIKTADEGSAEAEAWWEDNGIVHRSWICGVSNYGGCDFESKRYIDRVDGTETNGNIDTFLVCESTFHPKDPNKRKAQVTWRFKRQQGSS